MIDSRSRIAPRGNMVNGTVLLKFTVRFCQYAPIPAFVLPFQVLWLLDLLIRELSQRKIKEFQYPNTNKPHGI